MNIVIDSLRRAKNLNTKKESKFLQEISLKMDMSIDKILKSIEDDSYIIDVMISEFSVNSLLKVGDVTYSILINIMDNNRNILLGYAGEKKDQEDFLGYRFSKSRGQEGIEIFRTDSGKIATKLFDSDGEDDTSKLDYYIRNAFLGEEPPIEESISMNLKRVSILDTISKSETLVTDNPSKFFSSRHLSVESNSPFGDFIDNYEQITISLHKLRENGDLFYTTGLVYSKRDAEVPYQTNKRVITASNLSLDTARIDLTKKLLYLRKEFIIPKELQPRSGDIIISNASGSLKHLGKVIWIDKNLNNYAVGGFLGIYRFRDNVLGKAVFYRLLSKKFRRFVAGLRGQNINNLDIDKVNDCGISIPKDIINFNKEALSREKQLEQINNALTKIK